LTDRGVDVNSSVLPLGEPDQEVPLPMSVAPTAVPAGPEPARPPAAEEEQPAPWSDPKRHAWLLGLVIPTLPCLTWGLVHLTGLGVLWFYGPVLVFGIFPLLDLAIGMDARNPPDSVIKWLEQDRYYRWGTSLYIPVQYAGLVFACWLWSSGKLSTFDSVGLALTVAMVSGIAINTAHELGHKRASLERWLSRVALAQSGYGHFFIEHNRGHHVRVATPEDPASARLGESFYAFLPRTVLGSLRSAWELERVRLARMERTPPEHSWNSNSAASNVLLYHLQRHSDHHANPIRRYQALRHVEKAPQLPTGYAGMILLAVIPPLWRRTMDHRVLAHYQGELACANLKPGLARRKLRRYQPTASHAQDTP